MAAVLAQVGVKPDDRVAILLSRGAEAASAFFGTVAVGAIAINVNESLRWRQIEHILKHSSTRVLLTSREKLDRLSKPMRIDTPVVSTDKIPRSGTFRPLRRIGDDVAQIVYTSGSTGLPKGVVLSHANLWAGMQAVVDYLGITVAFGGSGLTYGPACPTLGEFELLLHVLLGSSSPGWVF